MNILDNFDILRTPWNNREFPKDKAKFAHRPT